MAQYLTAQWDYVAEGNYELSFKEGDKIKLLEKHNDDWWEGELNDEIGFFPANRTIPIIEDIAKKISKSTSTPSSSSNTPSYKYTTTSKIKIPTPEQQRSIVVTPISHSNPYLQQQQQQLTPVVVNRETVAAAPVLYVDKSKKPSNLLLVDISTESQLQDDDDLPPGWCHFYDESGTIYFFNKITKQSQWDKPTAVQDVNSSNDTKSNEETDAENVVQNNKSSSNDENAAIQGLAYDIKKLNLDVLHSNWIRIQSIIQLKIVMHDGIEAPWREYYAVLATGYLLIYKEGLNKTSRRPTKPVSIFGTIDLESSKIVPATKSDTRKKNVFIITNKDITFFINVMNEMLYSEWLDAIMRELISKKEDKENQDQDLVQLLASISLKDKLDSGAKGAAALIENDHGEESKSSLTRWFSKSSRSSASKKTDTSPSRSKEIFGGNLKLEPDGNIPIVVRLCVEQVDKRGLDVVGIYRLSGQSTSIQKYKHQFNTNPEDVNMSEENDINVITGLLKLYFRELKNPLLTYEYYDRFIEAARLQDYDERMFRLKSIIQVLPLVNYKVFQYLVRHLERVKNQSDINKMEASNLALIFSIGLLRSKQDDLSSSIMHSDLLSQVVETVLMHVDWFFDTDTDDELLEDSSMNNSIVALS